jgi:uncharacterized protein YbjQ (UPF0145 family)
MSKLYITTQDNFSEHTIESTCGLVRGSSVRSRNIFRNFIAGFRTLIGGEIPELTIAVEDARKEAMSRMEADALQLGANAIVCVRLATAEIGDVCSEVLVYGTAVKLKEN